MMMMIGSNVMTQTVRVVVEAVGLKYASVATSHWLSTHTNNNYCAWRSLADD